MPLFISHRRLARFKTLPRALGPWALDSGGFTEVTMHGGWKTTPEQYTEAVGRYAEEIGGLQWAAPMDWMCEPVATAATGKTVREHQHLTVENYLELCGQGPFIPVLQGWDLDDYLYCVELYEEAGVDLATEPLVGIGSVCRRQATAEIENITRTIADLGISLHGFGVKLRGIDMYGANLSSSDSLAWSYDARRAGPLPGCSHRNCANCLDYALAWRERVIARPIQERMF